MEPRVRCSEGQGCLLAHDLGGKGEGRMRGYGKDAFPVSWCMTCTYFDGSVLTFPDSPLNRAGGQVDGAAALSTKRCL